MSATPPYRPNMGAISLDGWSYALNITVYDISSPKCRSPGL